MNELELIDFYLEVGIITDYGYKTWRKEAMGRLTLSDVI